MKKKILKTVGSVVVVYVVCLLLTFLSPVRESVQVKGTSDFEGLTAEISYDRNAQFRVMLANHSEHDLTFEPYGELYKKRCGIWVKEYYGNPFDATYLGHALVLEAGTTGDNFVISYGENAELEKGKYKVVYEAQKSTFGETDNSWFDVEIEFEVE